MKDERTFWEWGDEQFTNFLDSRQFEAFRNGADAVMNGLGLDSCPLAAATMRRSWAEGWRVARMTILG